MTPCRTDSLVVWSALAAHAGAKPCMRGAKSFDPAEECIGCRFRVARRDGQATEQSIR
jgi:hypothetical protein